MSGFDDMLERELQRKREQAAIGVWREIPVSLPEFVESERHLGMPPLYPRQLEFAQALLGDDPLRVFEEPGEDGARRFSMGVAVHGKSAGKDLTCSYIVCYAVYVALCLRDPQGYLEMAPGEPIDIVNVAYNADQSRRVFFAKLKARIERWAWLRDRCNIMVAGKRQNGYRAALETVQVNDDHIEFPSCIRAWSRHAVNESYEGLNVLVWLMDEASAFLGPTKQANADAIYQTLRTSAGSRFGRRWVGMAISYPRCADDWTMRTLNDAKARPELGIFAHGPFATWEVNERTAHEPRVPVRDIEVPASLAQDFQLDYEDALGKYCCRPPLAREAFIRFPERLREAVVPGRPPAVEWEPVVLEREQGDGTVRRLRGVRITQIRELPPGVKLYVHGDPGLTNDSFALALGYAAPATIMVTVPAAEVLDAADLAGRELAPEDPVEWERDVIRTVIVALIVWRPDPREGIQVDLQNVEDTIWELKRHYPSIGHWPRKRPGESKRRPTFTTDHWNAALVMQRMSARKMNVKDEMWSRDFQVDVYRAARACFYNGLVELPDTPSITSADPQHPGALYELERVEYIDGVKIDHPSAGSKDLADALVRVIHHANEHNPGPNIGLGNVNGRRLPETVTVAVDAHGPRRPAEALAAQPQKTIGDLLAEDHARQKRVTERLVREQGIRPARDDSESGVAFASLGGRGHPQLDPAAE